MVRQHRAGPFRLFECLAALAFVVPASLAGQGLQNGDFEQPGTANAQAEGWRVTKGKLSLDPQMRRSGRFSGKLDGGNGSAAAHQDIPVSPGVGYQLSGLWRNGDRIADFDVVRVELVWLREPGGAELSKAGQVDSGRVVSDWAAFTLGPLTAPPAARAARIRLISVFGIAAFDRLAWTEVDAGSSVSPSPSPTPPSSVHTPDTDGAPEKPTAAPPAQETVSPQIQWFTDVPTGRVVAARSGKRIMVFFYQAGDDLSSHWDRSVFSDRGVRAALAPAFVAVRLDFRMNATTAEKLKATRPGTVLFYDRDGKALGRIEDHVSAENFLDALPD